MPQHGNTSCASSCVAFNMSCLMNDTSMPRTFHLLLLLCFPEAAVLTMAADKSADASMLGAWNPDVCSAGSHKVMSAITCVALISSRDFLTTPTSFNTASLWSQGMLHVVVGLTIIWCVITIGSFISKVYPLSFHCALEGFWKKHNSGTQTHKDLGLSFGPL